LKKIDTNLFAIFSELQQMANRKAEIEKMTDLSEEKRQALIKEIRSSK